jgi:allophanate hydrolase
MTARKDRHALGPTALRAGYIAASLSPPQVVDDVYRRIAARGPDATWISLVPHSEARARAESLDLADLPGLPLFGVPFSVKDNIDVAGLDTTAGCPDFAFGAEQTAHAVTLLERAGAILVGKTNLDQFATGLSGARSPYGVLGSVPDPSLVCGGSSSGAAVSVAAGLVGFAIGTDTAGSGRVPAALNRIVGVKPSIGLVSTAGVLPACASLDCVSVFAPTVADGALVLNTIAGFDSMDPMSRHLPRPPARPGPVSSLALRLGVPGDIDAWGSRGEPEAWAALLQLLVASGIELVPFDAQPFLEAGRLLYGGPWVAERMASLGDFARSRPDALHPVTREILHSSAGVTGEDVYRGAARLRELRRAVDPVLEGVDALLTPTVTTTFSIAQMLESPVERNAALGTWTTFTNLLDLAAVAVPVGGSEVPFGATVQVPGGHDAQGLSIAALIERLCSGSVPEPTEPEDDGSLRLAVVGAHLLGMPLHPDLLACGAVFQARTRTAPTYRLHALAGGPPDRPGLQRVSHAGASIDIEVYRLPLERFGDFLTMIPAPLGIGRVTIEDGSEVHGFICEPEGLHNSVDITEYGGWRQYQQRDRPAPA